MNFNKVLCDLGVSVSLMPLLTCETLGVVELKSTSISLQRDERSIKYLIEILKDIPIKIE